MRGRSMFQVGEVSRRLGLNPQTLYFYERIGLMPSPQRTAAGYRLYAQADLDRLTFITQAKTLGLSLEDIKELLALQEGQRLSCREVHDRLLRKMEQLDETIRNLQALKAQLTPLLEQCQRGVAQPTEGQQCVVFQQHSLTAAVALESLDRQVPASPHPQPLSQVGEGSRKHPAKSRSSPGTEI